ncbi:costunolide synthase-like protein [Tanacetum coccineum]
MDTKIAFSFIVSGLVVLFYFVLNKRAKSSKVVNLPPGPPKLPIIGNIHQLAGLLPHRAFRDLSRKHGPIMHIQLGQVSMVVISSPRLAKEVLKTHDIALADRPKTFGSELVLYGNSDIALASYSEYWRQLKKISSLELLSAKKVRSFGPIREQELKRFIEFLHLSSGKPVNLHQAIAEAINNVVCIASFGKNCKHQQALLEFLDEFARVNSGFYVADLFPDIKFLYVVSGLRSKLMKLHKTLDKIFNDIFEEHVGTHRHSLAEDEDLLDVLLKLKEEGGLEFPITNNNIKAIFVVSSNFMYFLNFNFQFPNKTRIHSKPFDITFIPTIQKDRTHTSGTHPMISVNEITLLKLRKIIIEAEMIKCLLIIFCLISILLDLNKVVVGFVYASGFAEKMTRF